MSTKPHKYWPSEGSTWQHWSDLLLATQLAAARAGYTAVARDWDATRPATLKMKCMVIPGVIRSGRCRHTLVVANPVDLTRPEARWKVVRVQGEYLESPRHPEHRGGIGLSKWLKERPKDAIKLAVGDEVVGFREMHTLEGALRADARRQGRYISAGLEATPDDNTTYTLSCVLNTCRCSFMVRLRQLETMASEEPRWRCIEIRSSHSCESTAKAPQERLRWRMEFFPSVTLVDGCFGKAHRVRKSTRNEEHTTQIDRYMGYFPVHARDAKPSVMPASEVASDELSTAAPPPSAPPDSFAASSRLLKAESALTSASTSLTAAESTVARLKAELEAAEKAVEEKRALVEKRRKKVERVREKEKKGKGAKKSSAADKSTSSALDKVKKKKKVKKERSVSGGKKKEKKKTKGFVA